MGFQAATQGLDPLTDAIFGRGGEIDAGVVGLGRGGEE
jgi:hypothetical protein